MSVAKVIEIKARSSESFEDAIQSGIAKAGESVKNIQAAWVNQQQVIVENGAVSAYSVDLKITFVVD